MALPCLQTIPKYGISKIDNRKEELFMKLTVIGAGNTGHAVTAYLLAYLHCILPEHLLKSTLTFTREDFAK